LKTLSKFIAAIRPRSGDELTITTSNQGAEFLRNQLMIVITVRRLLNESPDGLISIGKPNVQLNMSKPSSHVAYLLTNRVTDWAKAPQIFRMVAQREELVDFNTQPDLDGSVSSDPSLDSAGLAKIPMHIGPAAGTPA